MDSLQRGVVAGLLAAINVAALAESLTHSEKKAVYDGLKKKLYSNHN
jgi:hypothetical protein